MLGIMDTAELLTRAATLAETPGRTLLGIAGAPGAGKSTLAALLQDRLGARCVVVPMDGFHLDDPVLARLGRLHRKGAPDTFDVDGLVATLTRIRTATHTVYAPRLDRSREVAVAGAVQVDAAATLVVVEGNYLLLEDDGWRDVRALIDETWFLDVPQDVHAERLTLRRIADGHRPDASRAWVHAVDLPNGRTVEATRDRADLVMPATPASHGS
ncbi:pantothenate kinase [Ornithinimicrobium humiphilum]|uniref:Pantothenate kinase n=2 Tax=Ornithinimicrobium humiphilum TaxID=125288 RepID=A0A543KNI5_9MICO|nr:pantothenate kinase [Ornithinimicrobium humiphilum]